MARLRSELIAIGAARTGSVRLTENMSDMVRWAEALRPRSSLACVWNAGAIR
jgi:hypothetical protein